MELFMLMELNFQIGCKPICYYSCYFDKLEENYISNKYLLRNKKQAKTSW
jgi:hypothetical protein